jgi:hypothetical protein
MRISNLVGARLRLVCFILVAWTCASATADDLYSDGKLTVQWTQTNDTYSGTISLGAQQFAATAHTDASGISGSFVSGPNQFPFTGSIAADTLTLSTGGATYLLKKQSPANPLAAAPNAQPNPLSTPNAGNTADAPAGYAVVSSTQFGKALSAQKDGATSIQAALESTLPDLAGYFGAKPVIGAAYQDARDPKTGGATFSDTLNGQPVKGIISCKLNDKGAAVAVIFARADTSKAEWDKLQAPPAASASAAPSQGAATAAWAFPTHEFDFPDGTGSLQLADGWTTPCQTCINPVFITGPAQQNIVLNNMLQIQTPDSPLQQTIRRSQQMQAQLNAQNRAMGRAPINFPKPVGPPMLVSPYLEPVDALKAMVPQMSKISEYNKGPSTKLGDIISVKDAPCALPRGKSAIIEYMYTQTLNGTTTQFKRSILLTTAPQSQMGWLWMVTGVAAPVATFAHDAPLMFAMMNSLRVNQAQFTQNLNAQTQTNIHNTQVLGQAENQALQTTAQIGRDNMNTQNQIYQQQHQAQMDGYAQHNAQWAADETQKQRNAADFIETIKGTRLVYDTQTGQSADVNLNYATGVVDSLNQAALDPNRFVQVPLRDYLYAPTPVPGR